ncbi:choline dehydrogenase-like flavoprotein [Amycolatopsis bartoniae]|uniref:Pyranose oxidase n=1 Tax=Amycolatopsis bartoniae TaxID=941986 RepID=A0A8H9M8H4_9PSEU|nr:GMC oxidoreductase [Amycolatopsis bartoniae]MBB2938373.1 choline dehydrogenase-like flavoprotein [Amycolatopsis bartoniae]GHF34711.1 pyranose oxidase [Amycolatopsis bartoniae]
MDGDPHGTARRSLPSRADVLVVGSGPVGATFARELYDAAPWLSVLMVEAGPRLTDSLGANVRNLDAGNRRRAQDLATRWTGQETSDTGRAGGRLAARPGTFLLREAGITGDDDQTGMPAAALSANVGGMGAHWTCACPKPGGSERIGFLEDSFDDAFDRACTLLGVTTEAFPDTDTSRELRRTLSNLFDAGRPADRRVQPMPLACTPTGHALPHWSGVDTVLGPLARGQHERFTLAAETVCRRLLHESGRVSGAILADRHSNETHLVRARFVVVAADALRTPQLLWASDIRPRALGTHLNDQPQIVSALALRDTAAGPSTAADDRRELLSGVLWIPFHEPDFPFHTQVMQVGTTPIEIPGADVQHRPVVTWGRFTTKDIRAEDRVEFSDTELDEFGMPAMTIHYGLSRRDRDTIARAERDMIAQAAAIGDFFPGSEPRLLPAGSSLHYQGTVRMGEVDDGTSVCDRDSRVWGFENLYVAGNGVIPTPTACNPTATSVALAVLASRHLAGQVSMGAR